MAATTPEEAVDAPDTPEAPPQDMQAMRRKLERFGIMITPEDPLHNDPMNALADNVLTDAVALLGATNSWNTSDASRCVFFGKVVPHSHYLVAGGQAKAANLFETVADFSHKYNDLYFAAGEDARARRRRVRSIKSDARRGPTARAAEAEDT